MAETTQPTGEPSEGINTSPTIFRPCVPCTHNQHVVDYVRIMVKSGMSLPMGEGQSAPLITEVLSLFSPYAILITSSISILILLGMTIYSLIMVLFSIRPCRKSGWQTIICRLVELLHAYAIQQLELALLGSSVARLLDVLAMGLQHQTMSSHSTYVPLHPSATSSMPSSIPSVPMTGITDTEGPDEAKSSTSKISPPTISADVEAVSPKCHQIIPMSIPTTTSRSSSLPSKLPVIVVPELAVPTHALPGWINCPGGCKDYRCQLCVFQHTNKVCMLTHIW